MVCGFLESSEFLLTPVFRTLPRLLIDRAEGDQVSALIKSTVNQILALAETAVAGERTDARPVDGTAVRRGAAALRHAAAGECQGMVRGTERPHRRSRRSSSCTGTRRGAGPWTNWRARPARRAPCSPSAFMRCWARLRSNTSPVGGCRSPPSGFARAAAVSPPSPPMSVTIPEAAFNRAFKRVTGVTPADGAMAV